MNVGRARLTAVVVAQISLFGCSGDTPTGPTPEGPPDPATDPIAQWLRDNVSAFETTLTRDDRSDLQLLHDIVGDARIVALGEATHGTRDFFQMKHRILDFLAKEMGFTLFAMEATWPEMNRVNEWVHGGDGDPYEVLSGQYFWTWRTESVMDLLQWARNYNLSRGAAPPVSVLGFDIQYPGMAIHNVVTFLEPIDPEGAALASGRYACMDANDSRGLFQSDYRERDLTYQDGCRSGIDEVHAYLADHEAELEDASSADDFAMALRSARLVQQYEDHAVQRSLYVRDRYMAENAAWLLEQGGPDAKIVLWAHNYHVGTQTGTMGSFLRGTHGSDMVVMGFSFDSGTFTAVTMTGAGAYAGLDRHSVGFAPVDTYDGMFKKAGIERFFLDMRDVDLSTPATSWLAGPRRARSIGAVYNPGNPNGYLPSLRLPELYDVIIFFEHTGHTTILPYTPPAEF